MIKNKIRYLLIILLAGFLAILYDNYIMGMIFLTVIGMPFLLFAILCITYGNITAKLQSMDHIANKGEMLGISILVHNPTIFPVSNLSINLVYKNQFSEKEYKKELNISIDKRTNTNVSCNLQSIYSGNLEIKLKSIRIYDYFKIFSFRKKLTGGLKIAVLPFLHEINEDIINTKNKMLVESDFYSTVKSGDDPSEVFAIREYQEGDRQQRIHWKLSVKQNQLMIKEFSNPINCSVLIFVNLAAENKELLQTMDALLEAALSLSYTLLLKGQIHYLAWFDSKDGVCRRVRILQEKDLYEALDGLYQVKAYSKDTDSLLHYFAEYKNDQYTDFFYVSGNISDNQMESLCSVKSLSRIVVYIRESKDLLNNEMITNNENYQEIEKIRRTLSEIDFGLIPVNMMTLKEDIEGMSFIGEQEN
jgi:hypothetical protein